MAQYQGTDADAPFPASITLKDAAGSVVPPDDIPVWASSDPTIASVSSTTVDGTGATIAVAGRAGSCTITATSVNKSGTKIVMQGSVVIAAGDAVQGEIDFPSEAAAPVVAPSDPTAPSTSATPGDAVSTPEVPPTGDASSSPASGTSAPATADPAPSGDQSTADPATASTVASS